MERFFNSTGLIGFAYANNIEGLKSLLSSNGNLDVNQRDDIFGMSALSWAAALNHEEVVDILLDHHADVGAEDKNKRTAIFWASHFGHKEIVQRLLNAGADPWKADKRGFLPLHCAAEEGRVEVIRTLISCMGDDWIETLVSRDNAETKVFSAFAVAVSGVENPWDDPEQQQEYCIAVDSAGSSAFHCAAAFGLVDIAKRFLVWGVSVDGLDRQGCSALNFSVLYKKPEFVKWLLEQHSVAVNFNRVVRGRTPLLEAARRGTSETVEMLCKSGKTKVNAVAEDGSSSTALMFAAECGDDESVKHLLSCDPKSQLEIKNASEQTALSVAITSRRLTIVKMLVEEEASIIGLDRESKSAVAHAVEAGIDYLKLLITKPSDGRYRADVIEIALRYSCRRNYTEITNFILSSTDYLATVDEAGRSILSLAAEKGNKDEVQKLCDKELDPAQKDEQGRTPISWATVGKDREALKILLNRPNAEAAVDEPDTAKKRTPLAWAAEGGHLDAVKCLLDFAASEGLRRDGAPGTEEVKTSTNPHAGDVSGTMMRIEKLAQGTAAASREPDQATQDYRKIRVDSRDGQDYTPLCHAAINGHKGVVDLLLNHGADPKAMISGADVVEIVRVKITKLQESSRREEIPRDAGHSQDRTDAQEETGASSSTSETDGDRLASLKEVYQRLVDFEMLGKRIKNSELADGEFSATVVDILEGQDYATLKGEMKSVQGILEKGLKRPEGEVAVRWIHLPANNVKWVENLMSKLFEASAGGEAPFILQQTRWLGKQHKSSSIGPPHHARFMHPTCESFDLANFDSAQDREKDVSSTRGFVLFMPYLHWETVQEFEILQRAGERTKTQNDQGESQQMPNRAADRIEDPSSVAELNGTEKLYQVYLNIDRPLHIRRTLDQFHYRDVIDTDKRDKDQTCYRYCKRHLELEERDRILVMVDQLWLWVIPGWKELPPLVITAFPQRANRIKDSSSRKKTALILRILQQCQILRVKTGYSLAEVIVGECSKIFFDDRSRACSKLHFFDIYFRSIALIANRDTKRFDDFKDNVERYGKRLEDNITKIGETDEDKKKADKESLSALVNIRDDIADLREIKDIKEELSMMTSLFNFQKDVAESVPSPRHGTDTSSPVSGQSAQEDAARSKLPSPMLSAITKGLDQLSQLKTAANSAAENIERLLDLKNKQANLREVQSTRELDERLFNLSQQTRRQANTIMIFTVFTVVFLPPSFMSSFLALQISQFPWKDDKLPLSYVLKTLLSVAFGIIVPTLFLAFRIEIRLLLATFRKKLISYWESLVIFWKRLQFSTGDRRGNAGSVREGDV